MTLPIGVVVAPDLPAGDVVRFAHEVEPSGKRTQGLFTRRATVAPRIGDYFCQL